MTNARAVCLSGVLLASFGVAVQASDDPGLTPRVYASYTYDSNLFRVSGEEEARANLNTSNPSDDIFKYGAGFDYQLPISQQLFTVSADIIRNEYNSFDFLNYTGGSALTRWDWKFGSRFDGELRASYFRDILTFEELNVPVLDKRTSVEVFGSGNYMLTSRVQLHLAAGRNEQWHSRRAQSSLDRTVDRLIGELRYTSARRSYVGVRSIYRTADFPNRRSKEDLTTRQDNSYIEFEHSLTVNWVESVNSSLNGRIGWTERSYDKVSSRDFSGVTGQFKYRWTPSGRFSGDVAIWRDLDAYSDDVSSYVKETGVRGDGVWGFTPKVAMKVYVTRKNRDFDGDPGIALISGDPRKDRVVGYGTGLAYSYSERLSFNLEYGKETRESNQADREYDGYIVRFSAEATF